MTSAMTSSLRCRSHFASGYASHLLTCLFVAYFIPCRLQNAQISFDNPADNVQGSGQYVLRVQFVPTVPFLDGARDGTVVPVHGPVPKTFASLEVDNWESIPVHHGGE